MTKVTSAWLKKMRKSFKVGDVVTWGNGRTYHKILEVTNEGVIVDCKDWMGHPLFVRWNGEPRTTQTREPGMELRK